jgi:predicted ATPase
MTISSLLRLCSSRVLSHGPYISGWGTVFQGWALAMQEEGVEGVAQLLRGLAASRATGMEFFRPHLLTLLAEAYRKVGQIAEGLDTLSEALTIMQKTGERAWEAELYRLKGELTLQQFQVPPSPQPLAPNLQAEAEACFLTAIAIARQQQAKSLELRAVMSLARLWHQQGKTAAARQRLAEIYHWFTEGFDTKDLQEAKVLLDELAEP